MTMVFQVRDPAVLERVKARQTEQRHRTTFEHAPIGITHTGLDGRFIEINPQACEILGYRASNCCPAHFSTLPIPPIAPHQARSVHN